MTTKNTAGKIDDSDESTPLLPSRSTDSKPRSAQTKVPEIEINIFRRGRGPIDCFKSSLGGYEQDQLKVREILDKYNFKAIYAFNAVTGRGAPIRFYPRNGLSMIPYNDGAVLAIDGEPKDSMVNPISRIVLGVAVIILLIVFVMKETPQWAQNLNFSGVYLPSWILALVIIIVTRFRKRTKDFLEKYGW